MGFFIGLNLMFSQDPLLISRTKSYVQHWRKSQRLHGLHSPFLFDLNKEVFDSAKQFYAFKEMELYRKKLLQDDRQIQVTDLGAGSKKISGSIRRVSQIAKHSLKRTKYAQILFRLANRTQPRTMVELGTSLGLSTLYLSKACNSATIHTIEGCPQIAQIANEGFSAFGAKNIHLHVGDFSQVIPQLLLDLEDPIDFLFVDGNHTYEATVENYECFLSKIHQNSVVVLDDIHWSEGMERAWAYIKKRPEVSVAIDLYEMGLLFFHKGIDKQEHSIRV